MTLASRALLPLAVLFLSSVSADAGERVRAHGVEITLTAETPDSGGRVRGAILFDLEPGWKTYWLDPGESGIAPRIDFRKSTGVGSPAVSFPAPQRFREDGATFNGYEGSLAVAVETQANGSETPRLSLDLLVGVCREVCVPVSVRLSRELTADPPIEDAMAIDRAFLALPPLAQISADMRIEDGDLVLSSADIDGARDLFLSGPSGWSFGIARPHESEWRIPIRTRPTDATAPIRLQAVTIDENSDKRRLVIDIR